MCVRVEVTGLGVETRRLHEKAPHANSRQTDRVRERERQERRREERRETKEMKGNKGKSGEDGGK